MSFTLRTYCTGGDLFGTGAAAAGWRVVDGYEIDPAKAAVAQLNGHDVRVADVTRLDFDSLSPVWHEHTSPSCKTASQANTAGGETADDLAVADAMCRAIHAHAARGGRSWSLENVWGYRSYESFARILAALSAAGFRYAFEHINMANFGVPQTRKRLILWAVRKEWRDRVPALHPTHRKGGDMFSPPWVGWLEAIADLVPGLPDTEPAPWQLLRLPEELRSTMLLSPAMSGEKVVLRTSDQPSVTVVADEEGRLPFRAYLLGSKDTGQEWGKGYRDDIEPSVTVVTSSRPSHRPIAYLCGGGNTNVYNPTSRAREADQPAFTVRDGRNGSPDRALLFGDQSASAGKGVITREADQPAMTLRAGRPEVYRAYIGVWKRLTLQCLARFQTVPDSYKGLTAEINGNGVPCLFAQRLMEVLR